MEHLLPNPKSRIRNPLLLALLLALTAPAAHAESGAPPLYGIQEIVVQQPRFDDPKASGGCSLTKDNLSTLLTKILQEEKLPIVEALKAMPPRMDVARVELIPSIATINNDGLDCTSWVSLTAQGQSNVVIPPINPPRNLTITYWRKGAIATSPQSSHATVIGDMLQKMATDFARQYVVDQPKR